jgi:hypothetical protein
MSRRNVIAVILIIAGGVVAAGALIDPLGVDACLDAGGSYDNLKQSCDFTQSHPGPARSSGSYLCIAGGLLLVAVGVGLLAFGRGLR